MDATLKPGAEAQTVVVIDDPQPAVTKVGSELVDLPVAIFSRSAGSTSPISTLTTEAGVQTDDGGNLAVMGATAALLSVTVDGISSVGVEYSGPVNEMFPSFNSIEEIRVSESNNNAEFSGVADITTVSKAGTINYHGGVFENGQVSRVAERSALQILCDIGLDARVRQFGRLRRGKTAHVMRRFICEKRTTCGSPERA